MLCIILYNEIACIRGNVPLLHAKLVEMGSAISIGGKCVCNVYRAVYVCGCARAGRGKDQVQE
jgi:hypothetical protein